MLIDSNSQLRTDLSKHRVSYNLFKNIRKRLNCALKASFSFLLDFSADLRVVVQKIKFHRDDLGVLLKSSFKIALVTAWLCVPVKDEHKPRNA